MKKTLIIISLLCVGILSAQNNKLSFDKHKTINEAKALGLSPVDYDGYVKHKQHDWQIANGLIKPDIKKNISRKNDNNSVSSIANLDFETGDYTGWNLFVGDNMVSSNGPLSNIRPIVSAGAIDLSVTASCGADSLRHGLMTNLLSTDAICGIPLSSPFCGNYIARLNRYCNNYEAAVFNQTFAVTANQNHLNYAYAVVLDDGGHAWGEQPYFMVIVRNTNNAIIDSVYMQAANGTTPGFYPATNGQSTYTYFKPWTPVSIDLTAYIGQNVQIEVTASDCIYGGHSGYAYFDAKLDSTSSNLNVWPGDANYDLTVDLNDLFYLGWAYGANGTTRANATNNWQAEPSADWGQHTAYGTEFKHADCSGDGTIGLDDTLAIFNNYTQTHTFRMANQHQQVSSHSAYRNLIIAPSTANALPNQSLNMSIALPANATSATNDIYGISFRLHVPQQYISSLTNTNFASSYLGIKNTSMLTLCKPNISLGYIDYCLVKKDHQNNTGGGNLFDLNLQINNFTSNGIGTFSISNAHALTYQGSYLSIGSVDTTVNFTTATGIKTLTAANFKVIPNPANDKIYVDGLTTQTSCEIVNIIGQTVVKTNIETNTAIDISMLEKGAYFIKLNTLQGTVVKKFIKD